VRTLHFLKIKYRQILSIVLMIFLVFSLAGCAQKEKVVYPVEIVETEEEIQEETGDSAESADSENEAEDISENSENTEAEDSDNEEPAEPGKEDFVLLEDDDIEPETDEENVYTIEGKPVVDLVFFMGQSNMSGAGGDATKAPSVPEGHGYEFRAISDPTRLYNIEEPFGKNESFIGGICDLPGAKKGSMVSCFANEYYDLTGVPIVGVSASQGASTTEIWQTPGFQADMKERYDRAVVWLEASGYYIRNRYAIWFQGESDGANHVDPDVYNTNMDNIIRPMFISGLNKVFIVTPGRTISIRNYFDDIVIEQLDMCKTSGYYALGTNLLSRVSTEYMVDEWHYSQPVLNLIGIETARSVAHYTLYRRERLDYNYEEDITYIPDGFDYTGEEVVEPMDLSNIQRILDDYYYNKENENTEFPVE